MGTQDSINKTFAGGWFFAGLGFCIISYAYFQQGKLNAEK